MAARDRFARRLAEQARRGPGGRARQGSWSGRPSRTNCSASRSHGNSDSATTCQRREDIGTAVSLRLAWRFDGKCMCDRHFAASG